ILLAGIVYYQEKKVLFDDLHTDNNPWLWLAITLVAWAVGFVVYNAIMKAMANKLAGAFICLILYAGIWALLECVGHYSGRALYIHGGATFGTIMALNVWMIIWPYQKKILTALKEGNPLPATDPIVGIAGLRSKHNTYMSVPLVFFMISNHYFGVYSSSYRDLYAAGVIILAFLVTRALYAKAPKVPGI
ncbi:MAG TPA: urate hydroxylase PuuD, partial [Thermoanaerobaculia bacterium]